MLSQLNDDEVVEVVDSGEITDMLENAFRQHLNGLNGELTDVKFSDLDQPENRQTMVTGQVTFYGQEYMGDFGDSFTVEGDFKVNCQYVSPKQITVVDLSQHEVVIDITFNA